MQSPPTRTAGEQPSPWPALQLVVQESWFDWFEGSIRLEGGEREGAAKLSREVLTAAELFDIRASELAMHRGLGTRDAFLEEAWGFRNCIRPACRCNNFRFLLLPATVNSATAIRRSIG